MAFIDLEKAFDWVDRTLLLFSLLRQNVDGNMYLMIKTMYTHTRSCIKLNKLFTDWFDVNSGVKQGDNMSPTLFSGLVNDLAHFIKQLGRGVQVGDDNISILLYADDMAIISEDRHNLQVMLNALSEWTGRWRLKVNVTKTKIVHFRRSRTTRTDHEFKYGDRTIELVDSYKYLGCYLDEHLNFHKCSQILADSGGRALGGIITKFRSLKDTGYKTYTKLFDIGVVPVLNYGSEIWCYGRFEKCDYIMNRVMRFFLGAPTCGVQGDMGWLSMKYRRYIIILKFWNRLIKMDDSRLMKRVFLFYLR